jgi:lipid-A-disaccharide synthase
MRERPTIQFAPPRDGTVDVLFVAGEHSGDQHAALIAGDLLAAHPDWRLAAVGGPSLARAGAQLLHDLTRDSVVGLVEVLRHYGTFKRLFETLLSWIDEYKPRVVVLVDYPGFNLRLADALRKRGISRKGGGTVAVYQYVSPQIWAWKARRRFKMAKVLDELGVIFPFEVGCYADTDLEVRFVGHPFARDDYRNPVRYDPEGPILLLPGSRKQAVSRIFPVMVKAVQAFRESGQARRCVCLYPSEEIHYLLQAELSRQQVDSEMIHLRSVETGTTAAAVLTSSGTMSLNCALAGVPGAIVYRAHGLTAWLGKRLINVEWLGIANLVLGRSVYPEFIQELADPLALAHVLEETLEDQDAQAPFAEAADELLTHLNADGASTVVERLEALIC